MWAKVSLIIVVLDCSDLFEAIENIEEQEF
jgi:hypothetical protein